MDIDVFTLFPAAFDWFQRQHHVASALAGGHTISYVNYRDHTPLKAGQVDDTPFGGGAGMVLRVDVVEAAIRARYARDPMGLRQERTVIALTPAGRLLDDALVDNFVTMELSIGRYVLAGGELPAMVLCDAVMRKLPGALGHADSVVEESFSKALEGAPEYPHYTRPAEYRGWAVPEILLSGDHARIRQWRREQSHARSQRPQTERPLP